MVLLEDSVDGPDAGLQCKWEGCTYFGESRETTVLHILESHLHVNDSFWRSRSIQSNGLVCRWTNCFHSSTFTKLDKMVEHMRTHTFQAPFVCGVTSCGQRFINREQLVLHHRLSHKQKYCALSVDLDKILDLTDAEHYEQQIAALRKQESVSPQSSPSSESSVLPEAARPLRQPSLATKLEQRQTSAESAQHEVAQSKLREKRVAKHIRGALDMRKMLKRYLLYIQKVKRDLNNLHTTHIGAIPCGVPLSEQEISNSSANPQLSKRLSKVAEQVQMFHDEIHGQILPLWRSNLQLAVLASNSTRTAGQNLPSRDMLHSADYTINPDSKSPGPLLLQSKLGQHLKSDPPLRSSNGRHSARAKSNAMLTLLAPHKHLLDDDSSADDGVSISDG